jgi:hypothetical protein
MVNRVKEWLSEGKDVRIFTARVSTKNPTKDESFIAIQLWCEKHIGTKLPITAEKDYGMIELWDDRCVEVIQNKGIAIYEYYEEQIMRLQEELDEAYYKSIY